MPGTRTLSDHAPIVVGVLHPLWWYGEGDEGHGALRALEQIDGRLRVEAAEYVEGHDLRTARGTPEGAAAARASAPEPSPEVLDLLSRAHAVVALDLPYDVGVLAPHLVWVQAIGAGTGQLQSAGLAEAGIRLTNASGTNATAIAEFVIGRILEHAKQFPALAEAQLAHQWLSAYGREISTWTVGLVGLGNINTAVASRLAAFGTEVLAARRNPDAAPVPGVGEVFPTERLHEMLARCDVVVSAVPETADTVGIFDASAFAAMRDDALFINVGRGSAVDEPALIDALTDGHLAAAALDVASEEPLPSGHPLWTTPNVRLSGHCAAAPSAMFANLYRLFADNLGRFVRGEELRNPVDLHQGY